MNIEEQKELEKFIYENKFLWFAYKLIICLGLFLAGLVISYFLPYEIVYHIGFIAATIIFVGILYEWWNKFFIKINRFIDNFVDVDQI